jgi:hypothetical protein
VIEDSREWGSNSLHVKVRLICYARPANSRLSVDTLTFSPSLIKRGTRISRPVSSVAGLVTLPLDESPRTTGSVEATRLNERGQL